MIYNSRNLRVGGYCRTTPKLCQHYLKKGTNKNQRQINDLTIFTKMKYIKFIVLTIFSFGLLTNINAQKEIKHFIFFSRDREGIKNSKFYSNTGLAGAQITYPWRRLEPQKDKYDFSEIEEDLTFLTSKGKRLFIQIQDVTFDSSYKAVPEYLINDPIYNGGQNPQYGIKKDGTLVKEGWVARRWDKAVADRYHKLLEKLAVQFDGKIEGINLPETSVDFPDRKELTPIGFTNNNYVEAIKGNMLVLKNNFKKSVALQYANFMPFDSKADLKAIYGYAKTINMGMGGPDIKVYRQAQMENSYPLIRDISSYVKTGVAVQDGNSDVINPKTNKKVTINDILDFAQNYLKLDYVFWGIEEPFYSNKVLPYLNSLKK